MNLPLSLAASIISKFVFTFLFQNKCPFLNVISFNSQFANPQVGIAEDISTRMTRSFCLKCVEVCRLLGFLNDVIWLKYLQKIINILSPL